MPYEYESIGELEDFRIAEENKGRLISTDHPRVVQVDIEDRPVISSRRELSSQIIVKRWSYLIFYIFNIAR
jgi:hypothetical protein